MANTTMNINTFNSGLNILSFNLQQLNQIRYDVFYNPNPLNVSFQQVDSYGNIDTVEIPNWAMLYSNLNNSISSYTQSVLDQIWTVNTEELQSELVTEINNASANLQNEINNTDFILANTNNTLTDLIYNTSTNLQTEINNIDNTLNQIEMILGSIPYDIMIYSAGNYTSYEVINQSIITRNILIPTGFAESGVYAGIASTNNATFTILLNSTNEIGNIIFSSGLNMGSFLQNGTEFIFINPGSILTIVSPEVPDPTLANISITISATI